MAICTCFYITEINIHSSIIYTSNYIIRQFSSTWFYDQQFSAVVSFQSLNSPVFHPSSLLSCSQWVIFSGHAKVEDSNPHMIKSLLPKLLFICVICLKVFIQAFTFWKVKPFQSPWTPNFLLADIFFINFTETDGILTLTKSMKCGCASWQLSMEWTLYFCTGFNL